MKSTTNITINTGWVTNKNDTLNVVYKASRYATYKSIIKLSTEAFSGKELLDTYCTFTISTKMNDSMGTFLTPTGTCKKEVDQVNNIKTTFVQYIYSFAIYAYLTIQSQSVHTINTYFSSVSYYEYMNEYSRRHREHPSLEVWYALTGLLPSW